MARSAQPTSGRPTVKTLRKVYDLALWAAERDQQMELPEGRSEVLRLFSERIRDLVPGVPA